MPVPRLFATGLWLAVTATATAVVWAATSIVAADVTDRPAPVVAHSDVVNELAAGGAPPPGASTTTTSKPADAPTVPVPSRGSTGSGAAVPATSPPSTAPAPASVPTTPPTTVRTSPVAGPTTSTTTPASPESATYSTAGGVVGVSCNGFLITLLYAIPNNGFAAQVLAHGPANVDVRFVGAGQSLSVQAVCFGRPIRYYGDIPTR
jgi:hypothetical protein